MLIKTKKVNLIVKTYEIYKQCEETINELGVKIINKTYEVAYDVYIYHLEATQEQALKLLDLANKHNGLLLKGEA